MRGDHGYVGGTCLILGFAGAGSVSPERVESSPLLPWLLALKCKALKMEAGEIPWK